MKERWQQTSLFLNDAHFEKGIALYIAAAAMFALLGFIAISVDLGHLYTARADSQKIADAAALAGAREAFLAPSPNPTQAAVDAATSTARANYTPTSGSDIRLVPSNIVVNTTERTVQVTVTRTAANNNPVPTFFARVFGMAAVDVTARATAEVYLPSGAGSPPIGEKCVKPWFLPNQYDFDGNGPQPPRDILPSDIGTYINIKQGDSALAWAPGQYLIATLPNSGISPSCPECGDEASAGQGGDLYRQNISCCNRNPIWCGMSVPFDTDNGNKVGPTRQGTKCLIHQGNGNADNAGQDILNLPIPPNGTLNITTGSDHPGGGGLTVSDSESLVIVPMFDPDTNPIGSGQSTVTVDGFMQIFIKKVDNPQSTVYAYIIQVINCTPSGGSGGGGTPVSGPIGSPLPLRLVRNSGT